MGSTISSQTAHPLTVVVPTDESIRDRLGHLVTDPNTDRQFRFCKFRGQHKGQQGLPVVAFRLSAAQSEDSLFNVCTDAAASVGKTRDFIGVIVATTSVASGEHCYVMTQGQLGKNGDSLYPDSVYARTDKTMTAGLHMRLNVLAATSVYGMKRITVGSSYSGNVTLSIWTRVVGMTYSNDKGSNQTRGHIRSPMLHGGPGYGPNTNL